MRYKKIVLSIIASVLCLGLLNGCGHEDEISIKIETYLQEEYGEEFEVLSWNQPKLLPSDNGAIYATCISKNDPKHPFEGSNFEDIIEGQPYFGTIMRYGSDKFDDSVEIFKAAKQGQEQEIFQ